MKNIYKLLISLSLPLLAGLFGSIFTSTSVSNWYLTLNKPVFNPPGWLFAPVWTTLYLMMGYAFYEIIKSKASSRRNTAMILYFVQLVLNAFWSYLFFGAQNILLAFVEILVLLTFIVLTTVYFYRISRIAAYLMMPYIAWVSFAAILNLSLLILNY